MWYKRRMYPSGEYVTLDLPATSRFHIQDIAWALSQECRLGGSCCRHYSVAEHSLFVVELVPPELKFQALMHDAHEAYTKNWLTGMKEMFPTVRDWENNWSHHLRTEYGLPTTLDPLVKVADLQALAAERRDLGIFDLEEWPPLLGIEVPKVPLPMLNQREGYHYFLKAFETLSGRSV